MCILSEVLSEFRIFMTWFFMWNLLCLVGAESLVEALSLVKDTHKPLSPPGNEVLIFINI